MLSNCFKAYLYRQDWPLPCLCIHIFGGDGAALVFVVILGLQFIKLGDLVAVHFRFTLPSETKDFIFTPHFHFVPGSFPPFPFGAQFTASFTWSPLSICRFLRLKSVVSWFLSFCGISLLLLEEQGGRWLFGMAGCCMWLPLNDTTLVCLCVGYSLHKI